LKIRLGPGGGAGVILRILNFDSEKIKVNAAG